MPRAHFVRSQLQLAVSANPNTYDIEIVTNRVDSTFIHIYVTNSSERIRDVVVKYTGSSIGIPLVVLFINGSSANENSQVLGIPALTGTIRRDIGMTNQRPYIVVNNLQVNGDLGTIAVNNINRMFVGGSVTGSISATFNSIAGGGGTLNNAVVAGDVSGSVNVDGPLSSLSVGGVLGLDTGAVVNVPRGNIEKLSAGTLKASVNTVFDINSLSATNIVGSIACRNVSTSSTSSSGISVSGTINGNIMVRSSLVTGSQVSTPVLSGQIFLNASNAGGVWAGDVSINSATLSPKNAYTAKSADIGGGAVGLVPFRLHATDSVPGVAGSPGGALPFGGVRNGSQTIRLRHYGPVKVGVSGAPVKVEYLAPYTSVWQNVTTQFTYGFANSSRDVTLTAIDTLASPFTLIGQFRVSPVNLVCDQVTGNPAVANYPEPSGTAGTRGFSYFTVGCSFSGNPNPCDICGSGATYDSTAGTVDLPPDGQATVDDFIVFLAAFSDATGCLPSTIAPCNPADITGAGSTWPSAVSPPDGELSVEDFSIFLSSFTDGCDGT